MKEICLSHVGVRPRTHSLTHSFTNSCPSPVKRRDLSLSQQELYICVDARAELNLSKRLSTWSDSQKDISLWRRSAVRASLSVSNQISEQCCVRDARFILFGWRSLCFVFLFLKYIHRLCSRLQKHLERLKFATCSGARSGKDSFCFSLLHLNGRQARICEGVRRMEQEITFFCSTNNCSKLFVVVHNCGLTPTCAHSRDKRSNLFSVKFAPVTGRLFKIGAGAIFSTLARKNCTLHQVENSYKICSKF